MKNLRGHHSVSKNLYYYEDPYKYHQFFQYLKKNFFFLFHNLSFQFGQLYIRKIELEKEEISLKKELESLEKEEINIAKKLTNKYGKGSIDLKTGTFTPLQQSYNISLYLLVIKFILNRLLQFGLHFSFIFIWE